VKLESVGDGALDANGLASQFCTGKSQGINRFNGGFGLEEESITSVESSSKSCFEVVRLILDFDDALYIGLGDAKRSRLPGSELEENSFRVRDLPLP
jgi:hypothetical protein